MDKLDQLIAEARELCGSLEVTTPRQTALDLMKTKNKIRELCDALEKSNAERDSKCVILPNVPKSDRDIMASYLKDYFNEIALVDRSVGLYGMTDGEEKLANAILEALTSAEAEAKLKEDKH